MKMDDHEIDRIAAAMHQLRPDWPVKSLRTMLNHPQLKDRPRRDVVVALGWVACEPNTSTPKRVLESGPWWRAVAVDGTGGRPMNTADPHDRCRTCDNLETDCRRLWASDHDFEPRRPMRRDPDAMRAIVEEAKGRIEPPRTAEPVDRQPAQSHPAAAELRDALRAAKGAS